MLVLLVLMLLEELVAHLLGDDTEVRAATLVHGALVRRRHHTRRASIVVVRRVDASRLRFVLLVARVEHSRRSLSLRHMSLAHGTVREHEIIVQVLTALGLLEIPDDASLAISRVSY